MTKSVLWPRLAVIGALAFTACSEQGPTKVASVSKQDPALAVPSKFAQFVPVGEDEGRFEVAITDYQGPGGAEVSLVGAVHIADAGHYEDLQADFKQYEVLLYELVAESGDRPEPGQRRGRPSGLGLLQVLLKNSLELEFQLHAIDYTAPNFVHADLTPEGFLEKMEERGETFVTMFMRLFSAESRRLKEEAEEREDEAERREAAGEEPVTEEGMPDLVSAFRSGYGRHTMRLAFAKQLERIEILAAGGGEDSGSVLLEGRNERALEVLREQLATGKMKLGIYYGAAHMPGIEKTLVEEMGFVKTGHRWLTAWDITKRLDPKQRKASKGSESPK